LLTRCPARFPTLLLARPLFFALPLLFVLPPLLSPAAAFPSGHTLAPAVVAPAAPADSVVILDFETGSVEDWVPRPADRSHFKALAYRSDQALHGRRSLYCEVQGYEEDIPPWNEACVISYRLPRPVRMDSTSVVSWTWWFRDKETNDGIQLTLYAGSLGRRVRFVCWMSHSLFQRGMWPFDDPAGRPVSHRCGWVRQLQANGATDWPPAPWFLYRVDLEFLFPTDQVLFFDDLRVGPPEGAPAPRSSRTESSALVPKTTCVRIADLDGDGYLDQIIGQAGAPPILRLARSGGDLRTLDPVQAGVEAARSLLDATFADLDQDGRLDIIGLDRRGLLLFRGLGGAEFQQMPSIRPHDLVPPEESGELTTDQAMPKVPAGVLAADLLPGHGTELLLSRTVAQQMDSMYVWSGPWQWEAQSLPPPCLGPPVPALPIAGRYRHGAAVGDVDGDRDLDLVLANIDLMLQTPHGLACASDTWVPAYGSLQGEPALGDVDDDGDLDLFLPVDLVNVPDSDPVTQTHSLLWLNEGSRFVDASDNLQAFDLRHAHAPIFDDFDLDGDLDLFFLQGTRSRKMPLRPPNIFLVNDGHGRFSEEAGLDTWLSEVPSATAALSYDADRDGDPDLLIVPHEGGPPQLYTNLGDGTSAIVVCVLDRRGVPHAAGASIALYENAPDGRRGPLVGYRQSGVGSVLPGCGEAIFGCPSAGPLEIEVTWPDRSSQPVVRRGLRPGARLTMIEPAFPGALGPWVSRLDVARRRFADRIGGSGWQFLVPLATLYGVCAGVAGYAFRRALPRRRDPAIGEGGWRGLRMRRVVFVVLVGLGAFSLAIIRPVWPEHRAARLGTMLAEGSLVFGAGTGLVAAWLDSKRRQALRAQVVGTEEARASLLAAIDGFSHARWLKYLGGIAALTRSLAEGVDPAAVFARLRARIDSYGDTIRPQMQEIQRILPKAGLDPEVTRVFQEDCTAIDQGVQSVRSMLDRAENPRPASGAGAPFVGPRGPDSGTAGLERLAEAAGRMHETVQSIFRELGRGLKTDIPVAVNAAVDRAREELGGSEVTTNLPAGLPPVFAAPGDLANILENLLVNGARAARANAGVRRAVVLVTARRLGGLVTISVRDSGAGIPAEKQATLFDARITDPDRHGRGLPYARRRLHHLDGEVRLLSSSPDEGTEFVVTLRIVAEG
jgi:signal transduction histidine kinase